MTRNNKMKNTLLLSAFLLIQTALLAQDCKTQSTDNYGEDSVNCRKNFALYTGYLKQKNYEDAAIFWGKTQQKCPQLKSNLYANGAYIYKQLVSKASGLACNIAFSQHQQQNVRIQPIYPILVQCSSVIRPSDCKNGRIAENQQDVRRYMAKQLRIKQ